MSIKIHELPGDRGKKQKKTRVGRGEGSGQGKTAGKGHKGQQARSGRAKGGAFEGGQTPLVRRIPKYGFKNTAFREPRAEVTLRQLDGKFEAGATVDPEALHAAGLVKKSVTRIKVIASGTLGKSLTVKCHGFSAGARAAIEAAGGTCEVLGS
jgi:large subunit ribosomal protein L15